MNVSVFKAYPFKISKACKASIYKDKIAIKIMCIPLEYNIY